MKIEIKSRIDGHVIFNRNCENNTIKITLEAGVKIKADLRGADLRGTDLRGAYLRGAYLGGTYLSGTDLSSTDLSGADLRGTDLSGAYLRGAYLRGADLRGAYLRGADLSSTDLSGAYLRGTYLSGTYLSGIDLSGAENKKMEILDVKQIGNIGSRGGFTICFKCKTGIIINCGCFWGTLSNFITRVELKNKDDIHRKHYEAMINFIKEIWQAK